MADAVAPTRSETRSTGSSHDPIDDGLSLPACFARVAAAHGTRQAIAAGDWRPSYRELDEASNRLANALIGRGAVPGDRVALLMRHDGAQVAAALAILKAGCIGVALNASHPATAIAETIAHAEAKLVIGERATRDLARSAAPEAGVVDYEAADGAPRDPGIAVAPEQTAFLVYTSGSTGKPKAIMRTHALLRQNARRHGRGVDIAFDDRLTLLAALSGGQGIGVVWTALLSGAALCPFPVADRGFAALADWIEESRVTTYISSASVFRGFTRALAPERRFDRIHAVRIASEMATSEDHDAFRRHFARDARFVHSYGCSEVGNVAQHVVGAGERVAAGRLPVGRPAEDLIVTVVGDDGRPVPPGETGTIVITGRHLAAGYWREPALTAERFAAVPGAPGLRSFRSGDLGRFDASGRLAIVGRSDSQVKIHGQRVELSAVEAAIRKLAGIDQAAVCAVTRSGIEPRLVAFVVARPDRAAPAAQLRRSLHATLPRHMVPSIFVAVDALPLTAHGKIDRAALIERHALPRHAAAGAPPREGVETRIAAIWADALNLAAIGRDDDFFAIGGDSLNAAVVAAQVHDAFGVDIEMAAFSAHPTLAAFAAGVVERMARGLGGSEPPLRRIARDGVLPLSFTQQRLWAYSQDPSAFAGYRHVRRDRLTGPLDRAALRAAIETVVHRHEILRTSYPAVDGEPRAVIAPAAPVDLPFLDAAAADDPQQRAEAFAEAIAGEIADLSCRPLVRFAVVRIAEDEHILYRFNHHILGDGESWRIVLDDLEAAYACIRGGAAPPARDDDAPEYIDYASWQRTNLHPDGQAVQAALAWWRDALRDSWPAFAPGFRRPAALPGLDPSVGSASAALDAEAWTRLVALARANGATPFVAGLAATAAALAAESACDRIVVGTYVSMRNRLALERMLGDFTAPATILLSIPPAITVRDWIRRVNAQAAACVTHAAVPRDLIRKELGPLPDIALTFNLRGERSDRPFETLGLRRLPNRAAAMPWGLAIAAATAGNAMNLNARFDAGLYDPAGVAATLARLAAFIALASRLPDAPLGDLLARTKPARGPIGRLRRYATRLMSFGGSMSFGKGQT